MEKNDTVCLLKECDAGTKMAVSSIDEVLDRIQTPDMKQMLTKIKKDHEKLGNEIHSLLIEHNSEEKEPNPMAKGMSWMKTNMKLGIDESDATVADLLTDGCNMGIKSLYRYMNQYQAADSTSKSICKSLAGIEEELCRDLRKYL
ncbi:MAG: hypothetical protein J1E83_10315 [Lachnospiraceae bacterium]|nr:hypothetical protein [Lachnospiraceae bacterium]